MKRVNHLFEKLTTDDNLLRAIDEVNRTHHWHSHHRPNLCTAWVERTKPQRIQELREILISGFTPQKPRTMQHYDVNAKKWRTICEPVQWPDQYVHHALIQVLQPVMMRGMDPFCCGSIHGRGTHYEQGAIKKWMKKDQKGTKYELCCDIHHFYQSLKPEIVLSRMRQLVKDWRIINLIERVLSDGVQIGAYTSQWFANVTLQPLDQLIRQSGCAKHYARYMDNITIFGSNKRKLHRLLTLIDEWLKAHELSLKGDWQIFRVADDNVKVPLKTPRRGFTRPKGRLPDAVGYRYGRGFTLPRKYLLLRLKRAIARYQNKRRRGENVSFLMAAGLLSRIGMLKHCNNYHIYQMLYGGRRIVRKLKNIVRANQRKEMMAWNTFLEQARGKKYSEQKAPCTPA